MSLERKLIKPESLLIEKTARDMAATFYEYGCSLGLKSKYKSHKEYANAYLERFIPLAVNKLMDMLAMDHISTEMKDAIYDVFMERSNDKDLSTNGIKAFENILAETFVSDKAPEQKPVIWNTPTVESFLGVKNGKEKQN